MTIPAKTWDGWSSTEFLLWGAKPANSLHFERPLGGVAQDMISRLDITIRFD